jgi:hypothetical protein
VFVSNKLATSHLTWPLVGQLAIWVRHDNRSGTIPITLRLVSRMIPRYVRCCAARRTSDTFSRSPLRDDTCARPCSRKCRPRRHRISPRQNLLPRSSTWIPGWPAKHLKRRNAHSSVTPCQRSWMKNSGQRGGHDSFPGSTRQRIRAAASPAASRWRRARHAAKLKKRNAIRR